MRRDLLYKNNIGLILNFLVHSTLDRVRSKWEVDYVERNQVSQYTI